MSPAFRVEIVLQMYIVLSFYMIASILLPKAHSQCFSACIWNPVGITNFSYL